MPQTLQVNNRIFTAIPREAEHEIVPGLGGNIVVPKPRSGWERTNAFLDSAYGGPFRTMQLLDKTFRLMAACGLGRAFSDLSKALGGAWNATVVPHLPTMLLDAKKSVQALSTPSRDNEASFRKYLKAAHDVGTAIAGTGYSALVFLAPIRELAKYVSPVLHISNLANNFTDLCDVPEVAGNLSKIHALRQEVSNLTDVDPEWQQLIVDSEFVSMLKVGKVATAVAGLALGLGVVAAGLTTSAPLTIAGLTLSAASAAFAWSAGRYEEGMLHKPINFFNSKHVQHLNSQCATA